MREVIKKSWIITVASVAVIAAVGAIIYISWTNHKTFEDKEIVMVQRHMLMTAKVISRAIQVYFIECQEDIQTLARNTLIQKGLNESNITPAIEQEIKEIYNAHKKDVDGIYLTNPEGVLLHRSPFWEDGVDRRGMNYTDRPGVAYVLKYDEPHISEVIRTRLGKPAISLSVPVHYLDKFVGVAMWITTIKTIEDRFIRPIKMDEKIYVHLLDSKGTLIVNPKADHIGKHIISARKEIFPEHDWSELEDIVEKMTKGEEGVGTYHSAWWTGKKELEIVKKLTAYAPIQVGNNLLSIGLVTRYSEIARPINKHAINTFAFAGLLTLLFCSGGLVLYKTQKRKAVLEAIAESADALRESKERMETLLNSLPSGIIVVDSETHKIVDANPQAILMIGALIEQVEGSQYNKFFYPPEKETCPVTDLERTVDNAEHILITANGESLPIHKTEISVTLDGRKHFIVNFVDISESKRAERERIQREKLQSVIEIAGAICHEMNQPMQAILGRSELLLMDISEDDAQYAYIKTIKEQIDRMGKITKKLMTLTKYETKDYLKGKIIDIDKASKKVE